MSNAYSFSVIFFEKSLPEFKAPVLGGKYLHFGKTVFDTGLELELLQRFYLISLDVLLADKDSQLAAQQKIKSVTV